MGGREPPGPVGMSIGISKSCAHDRSRLEALGVLRELSFPFDSGMLLSKRLANGSSLKPDVETELDFCGVNPKPNIGSPSKVVL